MNPLEVATMVFGAVLALLGIGVFLLKGTEGTSSIKVFGAEFQLGGSALVIFVVGAILFAFPWIYSETPPRTGTGDASPRPASPPPDAEPMSATGQPPGDGPFFIVSEAAQVHLPLGVFPDEAECVAVMADQGLQQRNVCVPVPPSVACLEVEHPGQPVTRECFVDPVACMETFTLFEQEMMSGGNLQLRAPCTEIEAGAVL